MKRTPKQAQDLRYARQPFTGTLEDARASLDEIDSEVNSLRLRLDDARRQHAIDAGAADHRYLTEDQRTDIRQRADADLRSTEDQILAELEVAQAKAQSIVGSLTGMSERPTPTSLAPDDLTRAASMATLFEIELAGVSPKVLLGRLHAARSRNDQAELFALTTVARKSAGQMKAAAESAGDEALDRWYIQSSDESSLDQLIREISRGFGDSRVGSVLERSHMTLKGASEVSGDLHAARRDRGDQDPYGFLEGLRTTVKESA